MANITEILGTDSVSSSRPTINSNFELLNDELASVIALINPTVKTATGLNSVVTKALTVSDGTNLLVVGTAGITVSTNSTFSNNVSFGGSIVKAGVAGTFAAPTAANNPSEITKGSYFINDTFNLPQAIDGTEVTLINSAAASNAVVAGTGASLGATSVALDNLNSTITLRCFENKWYIISAYACTIS
ncbi:MAG: hypothetical protein CMC65_02770 [Flavobacteriaceae bacterium]|nr:hypothetical protein [Flavobacteriaceae bacterium]|tara:strand:+ start:11250 stop:11813 length:564 start_codon:yes stop_codon:yes gene_type:complete